MSLSGTDPLVFIVAGETSGDALGAKLMTALRARRPGLRFAGVGGEAMTAAGLNSAFAMSDIAVMGFLPVIKRLPLLLRRISQTAQACLATDPAVLVIVDSPDFTHRVARRVRSAAPTLPIINYVSPTVWAWRPGRARAMKPYIDHVLALLPFEPGAYEELYGPPCSYVGHPLTEQIGQLRPNAEEQRRRDGKPPVLLILPGSRRSEIKHHMTAFGMTLTRLQDEGVAFEAVLPTMPHLQAAIEAALKYWKVKPRVVLGEEEKRAAFRIAHAALAKSGTVTLELALAGVPMVAAYRTGAMEAFILRRAIRVNSVILANLVVGENVVPEFLQENCRSERLMPALRDVLGDTPMRRKQVEAFARIDSIMSTGNQPPSVRAAEIVLATMRKARAPG